MTNHITKHLISMNFFNELPIIHLLLIITIILITWLLFEFHKTKSVGYSTTSKKLSSLLNEINNPIILYNLQYQFIEQNASAQTIFSEKNMIEDIKTKALDQIFYNKDLLHYLDTIIIDNQPQTFIATITKDKINIQFIINASLLNYDNKHTKVILFSLTDITEQINYKNEIHTQIENLEDSLRQANNTSNEYSKQITDLEKAFKHSSKHHIQLQKALLENERQRKQLQEAVELINQQKNELKKANSDIKRHSRLKEVFFANTSHEIRTPLNAILGFTNLLLQMPHQPKELNYLRNIKSSGDNLLIVLNDILDFSKIEAGKMTFEKISFLLTDQTNYLLNTLSVKSNEKDITIQSYIDPELPEVLIGDPTRLSQIFINLIGNSIKFTPIGGKIIIRIHQSERANNNVRLKIEVEDSGIGISKEKIGTIFNSFTQAENNTTRKFGGTGLGLAIVKQLIELQKGEIFVKSEEGKGSIFTFFLPFEIGSFSSIKKSPEIVIELKNPQNVNILLAEDNMINQELAIDTIHSWQEKINIDVAQTGKEAIEMVKKNSYSMIFMDVQMPEMDGIEATVFIREKLPKELNNIPIIAMTAHALKNEIKHFIDAGMNDYISKPFAPEILIKKISYYASDEVQNMIKSGKQINNFYENELNPNKPIIKSNISTNNFQFTYIDLSYLNKIYKEDYQKIKKILNMYINTVGDEIEQINNLYCKEQYDNVRAKAHALKPKMNYLGCNDMFENAKIIEQSIKNNEDTKPLEERVVFLKNEWPKIEKEIIDFINN